MILIVNWIPNCCASKFTRILLALNTVQSKIFYLNSFFAIITLYTIDTTCTFDVILNVLNLNSHFAKTAFILKCLHKFHCTFICVCLQILWLYIFLANNAFAFLEFTLCTTMAKQSLWISFPLTAKFLVFTRVNAGGFFLVINNYVLAAATTANALLLLNKFLCCSTDSRYFLLLIWRDQKEIFLIWHSHIKIAY